MPEIKAADTSLYKILSTGSIIRLANRLLLLMNRDITNHNERTAYIALKLAEHLPLNQKCSVQNLVFLSLFHTIGFFRDNNIFENNNKEDIVYFSNDKDIISKYIFGCYYLEYMTPIKNDALALETFNQPFNKDLKKYIYQEDYKNVLYLAARLSDYIYHNPNTELPEDINTIAPGYFDPEYVKAFYEINKDSIIVNKIKDSSYKKELFNYISKIDYPIEDHIKMVKLLIYLLDFKSTVTMQHSINTSCYAVCLGIRLNLSEKDLIDLFISAFLHDVGKIAISPRILESPNKLTNKERAVMQKHVEYSKSILQGIINDKLVENVYRHHEKLNGKGYPNHLTGEELSIVQRILTVADITSALNDSRSYKKEYSKERTESIIEDMTKGGELDGEITKFIQSDFDTIQKEIKYLQELLSVDFSNVIKKYNDYMFNDISEVAKTISSLENKDDDVEEIHGIDDVEELEEVNEEENDDDIEELEEID